MKILLVQPNISDRKVGFTSMVQTEPLALEIIAASVPDQDVRLIDLRVEPNLESALLSFQPDLVGITGYTTDVPRMKEVCAEVKRLLPQVVTVAGGYHASLCPQDFDIEALDYIVVGEGEETFPELVHALETGSAPSEVKGIIYRQDGNQVTTAFRAPATKLDTLPLPARHLADPYRHGYYFHFWDDPYLVETARGCPYRCTFCAVWIFHRGRCRTRCPELVVQDLKRIPSRIVCFVDDNFFQNIRRSEKLYDLIKAEGIEKKQYWCQARSDTVVRHPELLEKWAEIGLSSVLIGFEKINETDLQAVNKKSSVKTNEQAVEILNRLGIDIWGMFIVDQSWTRDDFDSLIDYVRRRKIAYPTYTILTPIPGTQLYKERASELTTSNYEVFDFLHTVLPTRLPETEFYQNMARLYASTSLGLKELKQRIREGKIPVSALGRVRGILRDVTNPEAYLRDLHRA